MEAYHFDPPAIRNEPINNDKTMADIVSPNLFCAEIGFVLQHLGHKHLIFETVDTAAPYVTAFFPNPFKVGNCRGSAGH